MDKYDIAGRFTVYMKMGSNGFHGHYENHVTRLIHTFEAPGMSRKQIIKAFWDRVKTKEEK